MNNSGNMMIGTSSKNILYVSDFPAETTEEDINALFANHHMTHFKLFKLAFV